MVSLLTDHINLIIIGIMGGRVTKTSTKKRVDRLWSKVVREQAGNKCEVCGVSGEVKVLNAHHYIGRKT